MNIYEERQHAKNIGAEIRRTKTRIGLLEKQKNTTGSEEKINGIIVKINTELNRVRLLLKKAKNARTDKEILKALKELRKIED